MLFLLAHLLAAAPLTEDPLSCSASYFDAGHMGMVTLTVDRAYTPLSMRLSITEIPGRFSAVIELDPLKRSLPGTLQNAFFGIRYTGKPRFPLTLRGYADGALRWQRRIDVAWSPPEFGDGPPRVFPGHADYVARADDGLPVRAPRELRFTLTDPQGREVGSERYAMPGDAQDTAAAKALAAVEMGFAKRICTPPPPLID